MSSYSQFMGASAVGYDFSFLCNNSHNRGMDSSQFYNGNGHLNHGMSVKNTIF